VRVARLDPSAPGDRTRLSAALDRMVGLGDYRGADRLYADLGHPMPAGAERVRNGTFEDGTGFGPFDWRYANQPGLAGVRAQPAGASGWALTVAASPGANGEVARQLLLLPPGRFRLSYHAGNLAADGSARLAFRVACADPRGIGIIEAPAAATGAGGASGTDFAVPATACPAQTLSILFTSDEERGGETGSGPWIDNISIRPL
jgi:hypothetical protein